MKITINRETLIEGLNIIKPAVPTKATNNILKTVYMEAQDETLYLRGTDRRTDIVVIVPCQVEQQGNVCVDNLVIDLIPNLGSGDIEIALDERLTVSQGDRRHDVAHYDAKEYPKRKAIKKYQVVENPANLGKLFSKAAITLSDSATRRYLQGFYINPHDKYLVTGDGNRVTVIEDVDIPGKLSLPNGTSLMSILPTILKTAGKATVEVFFGKRSGLKVTRYNDKDEFQIMVEAILDSLKGDYPSQARKFILDALEAKPKLELEIDQNRLKNVLSIAKMYSDRAAQEAKAGPVILRKVEDKVSLQMKITDLIEMDEPLDCEFKGKGDFEIWFHPGLLLEGVSAVIGETVKLLFYGNKLSGQEEDLPFVLLDPEMENYTYLQTLMATPESLKEK